MVKFSLDDFWTVNQEYAHLPEFVDFKKAYKGKSSLYANAVYLLCDINSPHAKLPFEERKNEIVEFFLKGINIFEEENVQKLIDAYDKITMTPSQVALKMWQDKIMERSALIKNTPYNEETFEMLDKLMTNSDKIWKAYLAVKKEVDMENSENEIRGGGSASLMDSGELFRT